MAELCIKGGIAALVALLSCASARADAVADFYRNKTITVYIGYEAGGGYDLYARTIAKHLPKHVPGNPRALAQNMPGASSMVLGNYLARIAPRDGTAIGAINSALLFDPIFNAESKAQFKGTEMTALGNVVSSASVLLAWKSTGITSLADLKTKPIIIGATSRSGDTYTLPLAIKKVLGLTAMKIIPGYAGTREVAIALEKGEVTGRVWDMEGIRAARPTWLTDGSITLVAQLAPEKMPEVPASVALVKELVTSAEDNQILDTIFISTTLARPYVAPPGLPPDRVAALRTAFMDIMNDAEFRTDMEKFGMSIGPISGQVMQKIVADAYALPPAMVDKVRALLKDE